MSAARLHPLVPPAELCQRVVCLTEEPTEILYRIGAEDCVVGVSGFTQRPPRARSKPKLSTFLDANIDAICALHPDLVIGFSDLQATIAEALIKRGVPVVVFNQRSIAEILQATILIGQFVGRGDAARALADDMRRHLLGLAEKGAALKRSPRVYFEEWPDPPIAGIRWTSELIEVCGGTDICVATRGEQGAKGRIVEQATICAAQPDVIIASWCGKMAKRASFLERFADTPAVQHDHLYEIKSERILQPGPGALLDGASELFDIIEAVSLGGTPDRFERPRDDGLRHVSNPTPSLRGDA